MANRKKILCIVPLPMPITGAALASEVAVNYLKERHDLVVMNYGKGNLVSGRFSVKQLFRVLFIGIRLCLMKKDFDAVYLVISTSFWGNLRDMFWLTLIGAGLREKTVLHLHGANFYTHILDTPYWVRCLNKRQLGKVKNAIILGEKFRNVFGEYIPAEKIRVVRNFLDPLLLIPEEMLANKYNSMDKVRILFLSNLIKEKGYELLLDAFMSLPEGISSRAELHFAGEVYCQKDKRIFLDRIRERKNIIYHGSVKGSQKRDILWNAHVFCLPSFYRYEGQPISIIEAYGAGCSVLTTKNGGISDIFTDGKNGLYVKDDLNIDSDCIREKLVAAISEPKRCKEFGVFNREEAKIKYLQEFFCRNVEYILVEGIPN